MRPKVGIIDYGVGNIFSVEQACNKAGIQTLIISDPKKIDQVDALILPGVGSYKTAMKNLNEKKLINPLISFANSGKYFVGICLGMQLLLTKSYEFGEQKGLNLIKGDVKKFLFRNEEKKKYPIPQIQWNQLNVVKNKAISPLNQFKSGDYMYFVHSYYCDTENKKNIVSTTHYGSIEYPSIIRKNNIIGIQFHPEKSGENGLKFYQELNELITKDI